MILKQMMSEMGEIELFKSAVFRMQNANIESICVQCSERDREWVIAGYEQEVS